METFSLNMMKLLMQINWLLYALSFLGILAAILDLDALVEMLSIGTLLAYSIVDICVIILRYRNPSDCIVKITREIPLQTEDIDASVNSNSVHITSLSGDFKYIC